MKIQKILPNAIKNNYNNIKHENKKFAQNEKTNSFLPSTSQYLAFCGGLSLDLKHVNSSLEEKEYPPNIKNLIEAELSKNEQTKKTLYDVHSQHYKGILDCYSLDELKEKYPEFKDTVSVYDIEEYKKGSTVDEFLNGKSKTFSPDEDLTLQLIKLYWGQGFSLTDLSKYSSETSDTEAGVNFYYTMTKKLNIPVMDRHYARVLKLSNKEYNEKFTQEMSMKRIEAKEARQQKLEGEPVTIPSRELTEAHKKRISEGLKKYWETNPEAIYRQTKRQKEFYEKNPQYRERMSWVMDYAWNKTQEGRSIKKYLTKFMKKHGTISDEKLILREDLSQADKTLLEEFWKKNAWAKPKMSSAVKQGWEYAKEDIFTLFDGKSIEGEKITFRLLPKKISKEIEKFAKEKKYKIEMHNYGSAVIFKNEFQAKSKWAIDFGKRTAQIADNYYKTQHPGLLDDLTGAKHNAIMIFMYDLEHNPEKLPKALQNDHTRKMYLTYLDTLHGICPLYEPFQNYPKMPRQGMDTKEIDLYFSQIMMFALQLNHLELAEYMNKNLDFAYQKHLDGKLPDLLKYFK